MPRTAIPETQQALADLLNGLDEIQAVVRGIPAKLTDAGVVAYLIGTENIVRTGGGLATTIESFDLRLTLEAHLAKSAGDYDQVTALMWGAAGAIDDAIDTNTRFAAHVIDSSYSGREETSGFVRDHWISRYRSAVHVACELD